MPRHSLGTGNVRPVPPLDLEEVKFWLHIMEEHALIIKTGLPFDKPDLIEEAAAFEREFKALRVRADKLTAEKKFAELTTESLASLREFMRFKRLLLEEALTNELGSALPPLFFDHVLREAEYFMAILEKINAGKKLAAVKALEASFWLRLMAEHTRFIAGRIDPSERSLLDVVADYGGEFDQLSLQARDYVSFFSHRPLELPAFDRFLQDSRVAVVRLRDFKQAMHEMIVKDRMLSTIPAVMADHVRREADHFLLVLSMLEKNLIKVEKDVAAFKCKYPGSLDAVSDLGDELLFSAEYLESGREPKAEEAIDDIELDCTPGSEREEMSAAEALPPLAPESLKSEPDAEVKAKLVAAEKVVVSPKPLIEPKSKGKYKWGGSWPRQLGKLKL